MADTANVIGTAHMAMNAGVCSPTFKGRSRSGSLTRSRIAEM
jgi:hypothetical protein